MQIGDAVMYFAIWTRTRVGCLILHPNFSPERTDRGTPQSEDISWSTSLTSNIPGRSHYDFGCKHEGRNLFCYLLPSWKRSWWVTVHLGQRNYSPILSFLHSFSWDHLRQIYQLLPWRHSKKSRGTWSYLKANKCFIWFLILIGWWDMRVWSNYIFSKTPNSRSAHL